jgi:hypothetical protein
VSNSHSKESKKHAADGKNYVKMASALGHSPESEVRARAYQIFEANGRQEHRADLDWLQAERELLTRNRSV